MKSLLLAAFALGTQNVSAQKVAVDDAVATNIQPNMSVGQKFYYEAIVYQITVADGSKYNVNAIGFYADEIKETVEIIGSGSANGADFVVDEIEALNSALALSGTDFVAGDAAKLAEIELINFIAEGGFEGTIAANAFANLSGLTDVKTELTTPPTADDTAFEAIKSANLTVPDDNADGTIAGKYAVADGWKKFKKMYVDGYTVDGVAYQFGDVNCDGRLNTRDVTALRSYIGNASAYTGKINLRSVDVNGDGRKNTRDCTTLRTYIGTR